MLKIIRKVVSLALIPVQIYFGYLVYKNFTAKQNSQVNPKIIKKEINVQTSNSQNSPTEFSTEDSTEASQSASTETVADLPKEQAEIDKNHPKIIDLTPEATVNGLTIGQTTISQAISALGNPITIHQDTVYIYENVNLYFQDNILNGYVFPGTNAGFSEDTRHSPIKTSSGLTLGAPIQKVFEKYGPKELITGKIIYRDISNGLVLNISHKDNIIIAVEVGRQERRAN